MVLTWTLRPLVLGRLYCSRGWIPLAGSSSYNRSRGSTEPPLLWLCNPRRPMSCRRSCPWSSRALSSKTRNLSRYIRISNLWGLHPGAVEHFNDLASHVDVGTGAGNFTQLAALCDIWEGVGYCNIIYFTLFPSQRKSCTTLGLVTFA